MHYLNILVNSILHAYFMDTRCILLFTDRNLFNINIFLPKIRIMVDATGNFDHAIPFRYFGCQGFLIDTQLPTNTIKQIEFAIRYDTMERFNARRYIVIDRASDMSKSVFDLDELNYIADFLLVEYNDGMIATDDYVDDYDSVDGNKTMKIEVAQDFKVELFTHTFVGLNGTNEILKLDEWYSHNQSFVKNAHLYPDKLLNGQGRLFRIATFTYKPYSVPEFDEGTELQIAVEFSKMHNLTAYYLVDEEGEWGEIYDNWTGYGILGNVMYDHADVGLAALYTWAHEYGFLDLSKPVVRTGITCLTPAPSLAAGWLVPLFSFTYEMWIAVGATFIVCSLVLTLIDYYSLRSESGTSTTRLLEESILDVASIFLLQAFNRFGNTMKAKVFLHGCMFLFSLLIASSYSSGLASSMTVPRYVGAILTVQDLVDSGIQWGATSIAWIMSIMEAEEYNYKVLVERFVKTDGPRLKKYNNKRFAFSVERLPAGQFAIGEYITEEGAAALRLMQEDLYWEQCLLMTKKSSIWMPLIDDFILVLAQTGIPQVWEYRVATKHLNPKIQRAVAYSAHHSDTSSEPVKLHWGHVQGAFGILLCGHALAIICLLTEFVRAKHKTVRHHDPADNIENHFDFN